MSSCPGADGLVCIGGWLYSQINMMIFPANKKCPVCLAKENARLLKAAQEPCPLA